MNKLPKLLKQRRKKYGLSLDQAAELLSVSRGHAFAMETGTCCNPRLSTLATIVYEYKLTADEVLSVIRSALR